VAVAAAATAPSSESAARMLLRSWAAPTARAFVPSRLAYRFGWRKGPDEEPGPKVASATGKRAAFSAAPTLRE